MNKSGLWTVLALALVLLLSWHFLIKPYNYRISFETKDPAGLVYSNLGAYYLKCNYKNLKTQPTVKESGLF